MSFFDSYKNLLNVQGGSIRDSQLENMKQTILSGFYNNPSYYSVFVNDSTTPSDVWITDDSKIKELKTITTKPGDTISSGDLVKWNDEYWLTLIVDDMQVYHRGSIQKCPSSLKWQDSSQNIIEAPFTIKKETTELGLNEGQILSLPNERRNIIIQSNPDTQKIIKGQRFIFDKRAWSVTGINGLYEGLIHLTLQEENINAATDDVELRIANHISNDTPDEPTGDSGSLW